MKCPGCNEENPDGEEFCLKCGLDLTASTNEISNAQTETEIPDPGTTAQVAEAAPPVPVDPLILEGLKFHSAPPFPVVVTSFGATHPGLNPRKNNEDAFVVDGYDYPDHSVTIRLLIVADGMGGEAAGEVIAWQAVYTIAAGLWYLMPSFEQHRDFCKLDFWRFANGQFRKFLCNQIAAANTKVVSYGKAKKLKQGHYGATVVVAVAVCDQDTGHVTIHGYGEGDARAYLLVGNTFTQLSTDQTGGEHRDPMHFLGAHDHIGGITFTHEFWMGEEGIDSLTLILCSDGFWNMLSPEQVLGMNREFNNAGELSQKLLQNSLTVDVPYGRAFDERVTVGDDNITIATLHITAEKENE